MKELIRKYLQEAARFEATGPDELESYRIKYLGKRALFPICLPVSGILILRKKRNGQIDQRIERACIEQSA